VLVDPDTGAWDSIYQFSTHSSAHGICDVLRDPFGRFLVADFGHTNVWLLRAPLPVPALEARLTNGVQQLSWPLIAVEYALEETADAAGENWLPVGVSPQIRTNGIVAEFPTTNTARFYRLKH